MNKVIIILFLTMLLFFLFLGFAFRKRTMFFSSLLIYFYFYDYIFIQLGYVFSEVLLFPMRVIPELILFFFLIYETFKIGCANSKLIISFKDVGFKIFILVIIAIFFLILGYLYHYSSFMQIFLGMRLYIFPFLFGYLLYKSQMLNNINITYVKYVIISLGVFTVFHLLYQVYTFDGDLSSLWFYQFLETAGSPASMAEFNYLRDGRLRGTSVFVSSIHSSCALVLPMLIVFQMMLKHKCFRLEYFFSLIILLLLSWALLETRTRVGIMLVFLSICCFIYFTKFIKKRYLSSFSIFLLPISAICMTFIVLLFLGFVQDLSALGRISQYMYFLEVFRFLGFGFSGERSMVGFDSFIISVGYVFGIFSIAYFWCFFGILKQGVLAAKSTFLNSGKTFPMVIMAYSVATIYVLAFQFYGGSYMFRTLPLLIFLVLANSRSSLHQDKEYAPSTSLV